MAQPFAYGQTLTSKPIRWACWTPLLANTYLSTYLPIGLNWCSISLRSNRHRQNLYNEHAEPPLLINTYLPIVPSYLATYRAWLPTYLPTYPPTYRYTVYLHIGVNSAVLAYGQTGTGKTYTMGMLDPLDGTRATGIVPQ